MLLRYLPPCTLSKSKALMFVSFGLIFMMAPVCRSQVGPAESTEVVATLPDAPNPVSDSQTTKVFATGQSEAAKGYLRPTFNQRKKSYLYDLLGPGAFIGPAISAGIDQARPLKVAYPADGFPGSGLHPAHGDVPEWGEGFDGYSKRYADRFGQGLLNTTLRYGLGEALREDVTYHRCDCKGAVPRAAHAFVEAFVAHTASGRALPSLPTLASPFLASQIAVAAWYPSRYNSSDALRISLPLLISAPAKNLLAEFRKR